TVTYGSTAGGGPGATATASTGSQTWTTQEKSTSAGSLTDIASQPSITVYAADGSGTLTTGTSVVSASQTGRTIPFTYTAPTGAQTWQVQEKSTSAGSLANIASSPSITVYAADGSGTLTTGTSTASASQTGQTITFTYTAPTGGISNGAVTLTVPSGWSAPSTTDSAAGYSTASAGTLSISSSTITVSSLTLAAGNTLTITYGSTASGGPGAAATSS